MKTKDEVYELISEIMHPAIKYSLLDLGIVKDINVNEKNAELIFAFPFQSIPIEDDIVNSVAKPIISEGINFKYKINKMTSQEMDKFIKLTFR